jgi:alpha-glucosidase (family GH31 glycosyl hydrolase)
VVTTDRRRDTPGWLTPLRTRTCVQALLTRYTLLAHLYTLFYMAHQDGTPVVRALFYDWPHDEHALKATSI